MIKERSMTKSHMQVLMSATALVTAVGAGAAHAQTAIYGGGSTLSAPYVRQAGDCFGQQAPLYTPGKPATNPPPEVFAAVVGGVTTVTDCSVTQQDPNAKVFLEASGSGAGIQAFFQHRAADLGTYTDENGVSGLTFPTMNYATSDTAMGSADVAVYNNGGNVDPATNKTVNVVAPGAVPGAGQFANPASTYGPMVQVPLLIAPITIAFSPVYKKVTQADGVTVLPMSFNLSAAKDVLTAGSAPVLRLDLPTYCKIFNGEIIDWNDPAILALNSKVVKVPAVKGLHGVILVPAYSYYTPLNDPNDPDVAPIAAPTVAQGTPATPLVNNFSLPIELVGRSDGSGTTSIFSRALAAQCTGLTGVTNNYPDAASTLPSALIGPGGVATPGSGLFTTKSGSGGVAGYMQFSAVPASTAGAEVTSGKITYLSPDYVGPVNTSFGLVYAALSNYASATSGATTMKFVLPTAKAAAATYNGANITAPTGAAVSDPSAWVQAPSKTAAIATPVSPSGYPIVGTTQIVAYTCYKDTAPNSDSNVGYKLNRFLYFYLKNPIVVAPVSTTNASLEGILARYGFAPMPAAFIKAEYNAFVYPGTKNAPSTTFISPKSDLIQTNGTKVTVVFPHNTTCDAAGVTGG
jgi:ABC-type phosphate transport system substrate-binding protein